MQVNKDYRHMAIPGPVNSRGGCKKISGEGDAAQIPTMEKQEVHTRVPLTMAGKIGADLI